MTNPLRSNTGPSAASRQGIQVDALESHDLRRIENSLSTWLVTGPSPHFILPRAFPSGWIRLSIYLKADQPLQTSLDFETDAGIASEHSIVLNSTDGILKVQRYIKIPISAKRVIFRLPLNFSGKLEMTELSVRHVSGPTMAVRSLAFKLHDICSRGRVFPAIGYGIRLLLQGNFHEFRNKFTQAVTGAGSGNVVSAQHTPEALYSAWRKRTALDAASRDRIRSEIRGMAAPPTISILLFVDEKTEYLGQAIESFKAQLYPNWELIIIRSTSQSSDLSEFPSDVLKADNRIKTIPLAHEFERWDAVIAALNSSTGQYIGLMWSSDQIPEQALYRYVRKIIKTENADVIYSDEDKIDSSGNRSTPFFKPDWSPEYMLSSAYVGQLTLVRAALLRKIAETVEVNVHVSASDIVMRALPLTKNIKHIPDVLYHKRDRCGSAASKPVYVKHPISGKPKVSIIIPTTCLPQKGESVPMIERCINSILNNTDYAHYQILVLDRNTMPKDMEERFSKLGIKRISYSETFNYSRVNNLGAKHTDGEHLLFLNDDTEVVSREWLSAMLEYSQLPDIGVVGAKLLFPNRKVQHAGIVVLNGMPQHPFYMFDDTDSGYFHSLSAVRNYIAVTGACLMTRRDVFESVGGFDEFFPLSYNDVDYCIRVHSSGKRIVYTPFAKLIHHESVTRGKKFEASQVTEFKKRWFEKFSCDPYYNPNLTQDDTDFSIASGNKSN